MRRWAAPAICAAALLALAAPAAAREAYVTNSGSGTVSVFDIASGAPLAGIPVGAEPVDVAISPDGEFAYVADKGEDRVTVISTATKAVVASVAVGSEPRGVALTPDGAILLVANSGDDTVSALARASGAPLSPPIGVGPEPDGIAVSPDGRLAFVAQRGGGISTIDIATRSVVGEIEDNLGPSRLTIGPRGGRGFVTNRDASSVTAFNPVNGVAVGPPIPTGTKPAGIAIDPSGATAYAASPSDGTLTPIDTALDSALGLPFGGFPGATGIAFAPGGPFAYVTDGAGAAATVLDSSRNAAIASVTVGDEPTAAAVVPNQGPRATFFVSPTRRRAKKALTFHAAGSIDPDGTIADYAWDFGDGGHAQGPAPTRVHRYRHPGTYTISMVATDDEGCSTEVVFAGQTAYCNGSALAASTATIEVLSPRGPRLHLRGSHRQRLRGRVMAFARCSDRPCSLRARGVLIASVKSGGGVRRRKRRLGQRYVLHPARSWRRVGLRVPRSARRAALWALRRDGKVKVQVKVIARDENGDLSLAKRKVKLVRPR